MIDPATGELAPLYGQASVACGNRREAVCPACSATYKRDARQLVRAGLGRRQGHPRDDHRRTRACSPPSPRRRSARSTPGGCAARPSCPAVPAATPKPAAARTAATSPARPATSRPTPGSASPCARDCYDYQAAVLFNAHAADLWRRFTTYLPRRLARRPGITQKTLRALAPHPVRQGRRVPGTRRRPLPRRHPPGRTRRGLPAPARRPTPPTCSATPSAWPPLPPLSSSSTRTRP